MWLGWGPNLSTGSLAWLQEVASSVSRLPLLAVLARARSHRSPKAPIVLSF